MNDETTIQPIRRGRPKGSKNRTIPREAPVHAAAASDPTIEPGPLQTREIPRAPGRVQIRGRDGEVLSRQATSDTDEFSTANLAPRGWSYQWNAITVAGEPQTHNQRGKYMNGWRPVPAERHEGLFMPRGYKGNIEVKGLRLEERPVQLTEEAMLDEAKKARRQVSDQINQLRLSGKPGALPDGFSDDSKYRGTGPRVTTSYEPAPASLRPVLEVDGG